MDPSKNHSNYIIICFSLICICVLKWSKWILHTIYESRKIPSIFVNKTVGILKFVHASCWQLAKYRLTKFKQFTHVITFGVDENVATYDEIRGNHSGKTLYLTYTFYTYSCTNQVEAAVGHPPLSVPRNFRNEALPHIALIFCILRAYSYWTHTLSMRPITDRLLKHLQLTLTLVLLFIVA